MITTKCRISYPNLITPKANPSGALKYSCCLLIPKSDTQGVKEIQNAIAAATARGKEKIWNNKVPPFRYKPLRDGDEELASGERSGREYEGHYFVNCSSNDPPGIVDQRGKPAMVDDLVYAGCFVRADINPFPYKNSGNSGIGWGLNNVMFIHDGERLDGRMKAEDAFAAYATDEPRTGDDETGTQEDDGTLM